MKPWIFGVWIFVISPYLLLNIYNFPSADDFEYSQTLMREGFWKAQLYYYKNWSGRFAATFLMSLNPVNIKSLIAYKLFSLFNILFLLASLWYFCRQLVSELKIPGQSSIAFLILSLCLFAHWPDTAEGFYWMAGFINYTIPLAVLFFLMGIYLRQYIRREYNLKQNTLITIMSVFIVGSNESMMFPLCVFWLLTTFYFFYKKSTRWKTHFLYLITSGCSAFVVFLAPGNSVRRSHFDPTNPLYAIYKSYFGSALEHTIQFLNAPLLFAILLMIAWILKNKTKMPFKFLDKLKAKHLWFCYFSLLAFGYFPSQISMGGNPAPRVDNVFYALATVFLFFIAAHKTWQKREAWSTVFAEKKLLQPSTLIIGFLFSTVLWGNNSTAWRELIIEGPQYHQQIHQRQLQMKASPQKDHIFTRFKNPPSSVFFADITTRPKNEWNLAYAQFFNVKSVKVSDDNE